MPSTDKIYYSLDIETSGFDPETNEILEVGLVGFKFGGGKFKIVETWSKVFRPKGPVNTHVLGLTGIHQDELDAGADFGEFRDFLQDKLGEAVIVGHNVGFDIGFLKKQGLTFSDNIVDTMDLVQFLLPTHHSYNLENLMHTFAVPHKEAHRALPDAKACCVLLERLLGVYQNLPADLRSSIENLANKAGAPWVELLSLPIKPLPFSLSVGKTTTIPRIAEFGLEHNTIYLADVFSQVAGIAGQLAAATSEKILLVVPKRRQALELWRQGLVRGLFEPRHLFDAKKFEAALARGPQSLDEARFLMKLLVWQKTNWQNECLLDLNFSFFGGQFKDSVSGPPNFKELPDRVVCCDQRTFLEAQGHPAFAGRALALINLADFERAVTATIGERSSWQFISYLLKTIYNPETDLGQEKYKETIIQLLNDADLFFGLANAMLYKYHRGWGDLVVDGQLRNSAEYLKIMQAAGHFCEKLSGANKQLRVKELSDFCASLSAFFVEAPQFVKWISFGEHSCSFHSMPLDISGIVRGAFNQFVKIVCIEQSASPVVVDYFSSRLGLGGFKRAPWPAPAPGAAKKFLRYFKTAPQCKILDGDAEEFARGIHPTQLPAAIIAETPGEVGEIYKKNYQELKRKAFVLAEQQSGGTNKLFRNFGIRRQSLLLVTAKSVLNFLRNVQQVQPVSRVNVKTLALGDVLLKKESDPYTKALAAGYKNPDGEFFLPRMLYDLQCLLQFFHSKQLKCVYLLGIKKTLKHKDLYCDFVVQMLEKGKN